MFGENLNTVRKVEAKTTRIRFINLYQLDVSEEINIKKRLSSTNGACQVWIHTHFKEDEPIELEKRILQITQYRKKRDNLIRETLSSKMPVIAFIPYDGKDENFQQQVEIYSKYYESLLEQTEMTPTLYYVPTFKYESIPCTNYESKIQNYSSGFPNNDLTIKKEWDGLVDILNRLGVKKPILSGAYYEAEENIRGERPRGCVNTAFDRLKEYGFKAYVSNVVSPHRNR